MAVYANHWKGGVGWDGETDFLVWFYGLFAMTVFAAVMDLAQRGFYSKLSDIVFNVIAFVFMGCLLKAMISLHRKRKKLGDPIFRKRQ